MMSKKQWLALLTLFIVYLLLGAAFFHKIESEEEAEQRKIDDKKTREILGLLSKHCKLDPTDRQNLAEYCEKPRLADLDDKNRPELPYTWDFYNSVFFVITVVSTIGYGNLHPSTPLGRLLMILYALIGIPMNGIVLATMAEYFSSALLRVHRRYKTKRSETRAGLVADVILYLIPGFVIFIFLPTGIFMHFEDWTFDQSLYYAFVTLTTIGFGDLVAGQTDKSTDVLHILYKILLLIWIIFGLGYLVMILGFITRAMRSKKVARLEHKLAANLKHTQSKIWSSFTRDVSYLRRVLNEMYIMRIKPVYKDEEKPGFDIRTRSSSEPMLHMLPTGDQDEMLSFGVWRRRANSETAVGLRLPRVLSESDLERIDKVATFQSRAALIQPEELLAHVVNALGGEDDKGIQGFSDGDILASEEQSTTTWSIGDETIPRQRTRTASEVRIPIREQHNDAEWTWSGDEPSRRIHELIRARRKSMAPENQNRRRSIFQIAASRLKQPLKKRHKAKSIGDLFASPSPPERRQSVPPEVHNYLTHTSMHPALEETTLADFLRAMSSLHSRLATPPNTQPLRRKEGTANLTPPASLLSLFTPPANDRRMSLRPAPTPRLHSAALRRASLHPSVRRFSVRPVNSSLPAPPPPPPPPIRLLAPHLFSRQISDPSHRRRASSITDKIK